MSNLSTYLENQILNLTLRGQSLTPPSGTYLALFTSDPTDSGTGGVEASGTWYARQSVGLSTGWTAPATANGGQQTSNANQIAFGAVTGAGVTIAYIGIFDAASNGNMLYHAPLVASKTLNIGDVLQFAAGAITVTLK